MKPEHRLLTLSTAFCLLLITSLAGAAVAMDSQQPATAALDKTLSQAAENGDLVGAERALSYGANVNCHCGAFGETPLSIACMRGNRNMVCWLLAHHADVNDTGTFGNSPLSWIWGGGFGDGGKPADLDLVALLLKHGANVNLAGLGGLTPLMLAVESMDVKGIKLLLDHGADVNAKSRNGYPPLVLLAIASRDGPVLSVWYLQTHGATITSSLLAQMKDAPVEIARLLMAGGADTNPNDHYIQTAIQAARECGSTALIRLLESAKANPAFQVA